MARSRAQTQQGLTRGEVGNGFEVGISIALVAMVLDRVTQGWGEHLRPPTT